MERLTESNPSWIDDELWESACEPDCEEIDAVYRKLKEYEDLDEQGRLIKLPCKVGQHIYIVHQYGNWIDEASITGISEADNVDCFCFKVYIDPDCDEIIALKEFNETWFLTQSEAEAKLEELRGKQNEREEDK